MIIPVLCMSLLMVDLGSARTFTFKNNCPYPVWPGAQGNPQPPKTGWKMAAGATETMNIPDSFVAGRFWARTGCKTVNNKFVCESGDCGAESNGFGVECKGIGGQPASLAEFTLLPKSNPDADYYDLSNVDGYNVGIAIKAHGTKVGDLGANSKYNCGNPSCTLNPNRCPDELKVKLSTGNNMCLSICAAVNNNEQRNKFPKLQNIYNSDKKNLVCCACDCGPECGCTNKACKYGCSPYNNDPNEVGGKCHVEDWPKPSSGEFAGYDRVFKDQCPDSYSWQFDDHSSTYKCKTANYDIIFCP